MPAGRPEMYTQELADAVCKELAKGHSLRKVCAKNGMPSRYTVMNWLVDPRKTQFFHQYARARDTGSDVIFDELIELADKCKDPAMAQLLKIRIDTRKWCLARQQPKKYGEKQQHELSGPGGKPIETTRKLDLSSFTDEELKLLEKIGLANNEDIIEK